MKYGEVESHLIIYKGLWWSYFKHTASSHDDLRDDTEFYVVTVLFEEERKFEANRTILTKQQYLLKLLFLKVIHTHPPIN